MSNEPQIDQTASHRDAMVAALLATKARDAMVVAAMARPTRVGKAGAALPIAETMSTMPTTPTSVAATMPMIAAATMPSAPTTPQMSTSWLELSGPRLPARSARATEPPRMTMSMMPWISPVSPAQPVVEDAAPARMTMSRQIVVARTTIGRQR